MLSKNNTAESSERKYIFKLEKLCLVWGARVPCSPYYGSARELDESRCVQFRKYTRRQQRPNARHKITRRICQIL